MATKNSTTTLNTDDVKAMVLTIVNLPSRIEAIFNEGNEDEILMATKFLSLIGKEFNKAVNLHDKLVDAVHDGSHGSDYLPKVKRIHEPRGRKAGVKVTQEISLVDKIFG